MEMKGVFAAESTAWLDPVHMAECDSGMCLRRVAFTRSTRALCDFG